MLAITRTLLHGLRTHLSGKSLRPAVEKYTNDMILEAMSSTFATSRIVDLFNKEMPQYLYRQATLNPINLLNQVDPFEAKLIAHFKANREMKEVTGTRVVSGTNSFYVARPIQVEQKYLECHGDPAEAPPAVIEHYGPTNGFGWQVGDIVSALMIYVPTADLQAQIVSMLRTLLGTFGVLTIVLGGVIYIVFDRLVNRRLQRASGIMSRTAANPAAHEQIDDASGDEIGTMAQAFNHMSEQLQIAFRTLRASEKKYRSLFEDSKDAIFITTPEGTILDLNPAGLYLLGLRQDEITTCNIGELYVHPDDRLRFRHEMDQHGTVTNFEVTLQKRDGSPFDALLTATLRDGDTGADAVYQGLIRDITVQKQHERLHAENLRMRTELEVTHKLQQMLLPTAEELHQIPDLDIACYMEPADEVGGDYYDILQHNGQIKIGIGDVTGHGLESGVVMVMTQAIVRALLANGETDPVRFLDTLNAC